VSAIEITVNNFEAEVLKSPVPVLIDFWAPWCGPCKVIGPLVEEIAGEYPDSLKVGKINVDEEGALAEQHGIVSIPTLVVYKDGALAASKTGAAPKNDIISLFKNLV
jgi:thioredoxin 1